MRFILTTAIVLLSGCRTPGPTEDSALLAASFKDIPADEDAVRPTPEGRMALLRNALAYAPWPSDERGERTLAQGPKQIQFKNGALDRQKTKEFALNQFVECRYLAPWQDDRPGGKTPKFFCTYSYQNNAGEAKTRKLKIKYDSGDSPAINTGVYGEVLATRLLWALGYPSDTVLPIQVRCTGCPSEPWKHVSGYWDILETEQRLTTMQPGSNNYIKTERDLVKDSVRYVVESLSRFQEYQGLRAERQGDVHKIFDAANNEIFNTTDGQLTGKAGAKTVIWDAAKKRLATVQKDGYTDFKVNELATPELGATTPRIRDYASAVVEWKHNSIPIETHYHEGWSFNVSDRDPGRPNELRIVDPANATAVSQRQELALLAAFISHADNKAEQQRFICLDAASIEAEDKDCKAVADPRSKLCQDGTDKKFESCSTPVLMLQDLGFAMGFGAKVSGTLPNGEVQFDGSPQAKSYGTADPQGFLDAPIFKDETSCTTTVNEWATGVEIEERVSEPARLRLVAKLQTLAANDQDLSDLFRAGRLYLKELHKEGKPFPALDPTNAPLTPELAATESDLIARWKTSFKAKVAKLAAISCPAS